MDKIEKKLSGKLNMKEVGIIKSIESDCDT